MTLVLAASLFFTNPAPLDMPRADAYLVKEDGRYRLEDRYDTLDLWQSRAVLGRWEDDDGRVFTLSRLDVAPPPFAVAESLTRADYTASRIPLGRKDDLRRPIALLTSASLAETPRRPRQLARGFREIVYWQHPTNYASVVCAFLPEKARHWYLADWELAPGDDYPERMQAFEREFLDRFWKDGTLPSPLAAAFAALGEKPDRSRRRAAAPGERELLRADAHHNVANYVNWHFVDSDEFTVLSDMPGDAGFLVALTNDLKALRARSAEVLPTKIDGTNALCVARLFADREEYLDAVDEDMSWTAAYWSPLRRELVAYLPAGGEKALLKTIRHEAFHQYLSYATSMISVSPWLNEGYAQYFEDEACLSWGDDIELTPERIDGFAAILPGVLGMDYEQFYSGTDFERRVKYRLAWSVAVFLEKGASEVRFQPFRTLTRDYLDSLFETRDMRKSTTVAFRNADHLKLFVAEWKKFWKTR